MTRSKFVMTAASSPERNEDLERRWSDDLPAIALAQFGRLALVHRGEGAVRPLLLLQQPARPGRSIEKQHPPGFRAAVLPCMRHAAWHVGAGDRMSTRLNSSHQIISYAVFCLKRKRMGNVTLANVLAAQPVA